MRLLRNEFVAWLEAKEATAIVGESRDGCRCPLATFYDENSADEVYIYDSGDGRIMESPIIIYLPDLTMTKDGDE